MSCPKKKKSNLCFCFSSFVESILRDKLLLILSNYIGFLCLINLELLKHKNITVFLALFSSCDRCRFYCKRHNIRKLGRSGKAPGSCSPHWGWPCGDISMQYNWLPRHTIRPFKPPILPWMWYLRYSRFHFR